MTAAVSYTEGVLRVCCANPANLRMVDVYAPAPGGLTVPGLHCKECAACGRRHYELDAEPGHYNLRNA